MSDNNWEQAPAVQVDHIIVAISSLESGIRLVEEKTGVRPVYGGRHPGMGTQNALLALGPASYLEILAPQDDAELPEAVRWLLDLRELTMMGFAASTSDISSTASWLREHGYTTSDLSEGSRSTPDGNTLAWTTLGITDPVLVGAPFYIAWNDGSVHPAATSPAGCTLRKLTVASPDFEALGQLFGDIGLDVVVESGTDAQGRYEAMLDCPKGAVVLR